MSCDGYYCRRGRVCICKSSNRSEYDAFQAMQQRNGGKRINTESRMSPWDHFYHWLMVVVTIALILFITCGGAAFVYFNFIA